MKALSEKETIQDYQAGDGWKLVWSDDFTDEKLNTNNWNRQVEEPGRFNKEWQRYTDSERNAFIENGQLVIEAHYDADEHKPGSYSSARLNTAGKQSWQYGKFVARMKLPYGRGLWPAFWTLGENIDENGGDTPWPFCGEIDIHELYGFKDNGLIEVNAHYANKEGVHTQFGAKPYHLEEGRFADDFHDFELEWNENELVWRVDGNDVARMDIRDEQFYMFHHKHFILMNVAVGSEFADHPDDTTEFPQRMTVDWVRVYQKA